MTQWQRVRKPWRGLTPEEKKLWARLRQGDKEARAELVQKHMGLVVSLAQRYSNRAIPISELIEDGLVGLMKAIKRFNPQRAVAFSTYATPWIRQSIQEAVRHSQDLAIPDYLMEYLRLWRHTEQALAQKRNCLPSGEEILDEIAKILRQHHQSQRFKYLKHLERSTTMIKAHLENVETLAGRYPTPTLVHQEFEQLARQFEISELLETLKGLEERSQGILKMRFGLDGFHPMTLEEIGRNFRLSRERVRQIIEASLGRLKKLLASSTPR